MSTVKPSLPSLEALRPWQLEAITGLKQSNFIPCSRRSGKTWLVAFILSRQLITTPQAPLPPMELIFAAPQLGQAKKLLMPLLQQFLMDYPFIKYDDQQSTVSNKRNGNRLLLLGLEDARVASHARGAGADLCCLDESGQIPVETFFSVLRPMLQARPTISKTDPTRLSSSPTRKGVFIAIGTPPPSHSLYSELLAIHKEGQALDPNTYFFRQYDVYQAGVLSKEDIAEEIRLTPKPIFAREFLLRLDVGDELSYASPDQMDKLFDNDPGQYHPTEQHAIGWDFAQKHDRSLICHRLDHKVIGFQELTGPPSTQVSQLADYMRQHHIQAGTLAYDATGCGLALLEPLQRFFEPYPEILEAPVTFNERATRPDLSINRRCELFRRGQIWLRLESSYLPKTADTLLLAKELTSLRLKPDDGNKFKLEAKLEQAKRVGHHPDAQDAWALTMAEAWHLDDQPGRDYQPSTLKDVVRTGVLPSTSASSPLRDTFSDIYGAGQVSDPVWKDSILNEGNNAY